MAKGVATAQDLDQMYTNSVVMYKNRPYYVTSVNGHKEARCLNLSSQRTEELEINEIDFKAPTCRLGFINVGKSVFYMSRTPIRRYKVGLSKENIRVNTIHDLNYGRDSNADLARVKALTCVELSDVVFNKYPDIEEAFRIAREHGHSAVAFDKQFAISTNGYIYYKLKRVGTVARMPKTVDDITFDAGYSHLTILLDNNHEKNLSVA